MLTHGMTGTPTYCCWRNMVRRCTNPKAHNYTRYGARGIGVSDRWLVFENFLEDMGVRPDGKTLDRIDNSKGYYVENCRWATMLDQGNNRRGNLQIAYNGQTKTVSEWGRIHGLKHSTLLARLFRWGWPVEKALTQKLRRKQQSRLTGG